jgi:hypothetical protein
LYPLEKGGGAEKLFERPNMGYVVWYNPKTYDIKAENDSIDKTKINREITIDSPIYDKKSKV